MVIGEKDTDVSTTKMCLSRYIYISEEYYGSEGVLM
jgi:hypothetical protein